MPQFHSQQSQWHSLQKQGRPGQCFSCTLHSCLFPVPLQPLPDDDASLTHQQSLRKGARHAFKICKKYQVGFWAGVLCCLWRQRDWVGWAEAKESSLWHSVVNLWSPRPQGVLGATGLGSFQMELERDSLRSGRLQD